MKKKNGFSIVYISLVLILLYLPILIVVIYSFNGNSSRTAAVRFQGFSLQWYKGLFNPISGYGRQLVSSLEVAFWSVLISAVIGTLGAFSSIKRQKIKGLRSRVYSGMENIAMLPIMIPEIILAIAFMTLFSKLNLPFGKLTLVLAHVSFCIPYILITVKSRLSTIDPALEEAARDLGASPFRAFMTVSLPLVAPGVISGSLLAFAMSMDDFVISFFVNGAETSTLPIKIYSSVKVGVTPKVNALCTVMLMSVFLVFAVVQVISDVQEKKKAVNIEERI